MRLALLFTRRKVLQTERVHVVLNTSVRWVESIIGAKVALYVLKKRKILLIFDKKRGISSIKNTQLATLFPHFNRRSDQIDSLEKLLYRMKYVFTNIQRGLLTYRR